MSRQRFQQHVATPLLYALFACLALLAFGCRRDDSRERLAKREAPVTEEPTFAGIPTDGEYRWSSWLGGRAGDYPVWLTLHLSVSSTGSVTGLFSVAAYRDWDGNDNPSSPPVFVKITPSRNAAIRNGEFSLPNFRIPIDVYEASLNIQKLRGIITMANGNEEWSDNLTIDVTGRFVDRNAIEGLITREKRTWLKWRAISWPTSISPAVYQNMIAIVADAQQDPFVRMETCRAMARSGMVDSNGIHAIELMLHDTGIGVSNTAATALAELRKGQKSDRNR